MTLARLIFRVRAKKDPRGTGPPVPQRNIACFSEIATTFEVEGQVARTCAIPARRIAEVRNSTSAPSAPSFRTAPLPIRRKPIAGENASNSRSPAEHTKLVKTSTKLANVLADIL
jgi:hypothetical protein